MALAMTRLPTERPVADAAGQASANACAPQAVAGPMPVGPSPRRRTLQSVVRWGLREVRVGGDAPVVVQSMTNTDTADARATALQVRDLARAGSELVRITVNTPAAAAAVGRQEDSSAPICRARQGRCDWDTRSR